MALMSFEEWRAQQNESSPATRLRRDAALGLKPPIPDASINSHSTAAPWEAKRLAGKGKKKKKSAAKKKK